MISALLHLQLWSFVNRTMTRLKRLRQPKYLIGAIVGGAYFYFYFFRFLFQSGGHAPAPGLSPGSLAGYESAAAVVLLVIVLGGWVVPNRRAALVFSEAEIHFLFPAPITRRGLIHYKLLKSQLAILFSTLILALVTGRFRSTASGLWIHAAGWWVVLSTLNLHFLGASFVRTMLFERGVSNWQRRLVLLGGAALAGTAIVLWTRQAVPPPVLAQLVDPRALVDYVQTVSQFGALPWLLLPVRAVVRPFLAPDATAFLLALGPALLVLALHYLWVVRSNVAFEEASLELSRRVADQVAAVRAGNYQVRREGARRQRAPFALRPTGLPAVAFLWKNLISLSQGFSWRFWLVLTIPVVAMAATLRGNEDFAALFGVLTIMLGVWSLLLGPMVLRQDLRQDVAVMDILKAYPVPGWQVVLGELLAPAAVLTLLQWGLVGMVVLVFEHTPGRLPETIPLVNRLAFGAGAAVILPALNLVSLVIPNAAVLVFPAWFHAGKDGPHGIEATGQRLVYMIGQMLVFALSLLPAALAFAAVFFPVSFLTGQLAAVPVASLAASVALLAEVYVAVRLLGRVFEKFDLSAEPTT